MKSRHSRLDSTRGRAPRRAGGRRAALLGFTLIELLTILVILSVLISIATPTIIGARKQFRMTESRARMKMIAGGIGFYYNDFALLPESTKDTVGSVSMLGRHRLVQALTGYLQKSQDGQEGLGFRLRERGKVYGPYNGTENLEQTDPKVTGQAATFLDAFGNEIFYYRFKPGAPGSETGTFEAADNAPDGPPQLNQYLKDPNDNYYRKDYVLITPGPNTTWEDPNDDADEIANFPYTRR